MRCFDSARAGTVVNPLETLTGRHILVVEDEHIVAEALARCVRACVAVVVDPAATVEQALLHLESSRVDEALFDFNCEGSRRMRWLRPHRCGVPFVFETGYGSVVPDRYRHVAVIQKPFDVVET